MSGQSSTLTPAITKPDSPLAATEEQVNVSATHAARYPQLAVVDPDWLHRLLGRPFRAAQSSHNWIVRLGRRLTEDRLPALLAEGGDATQLWLRRGARLFPSEQIRPHLRTPVHPGPQGILLESAGHSACWRRRGKFVRQHPAPSPPLTPCQNRRAVRSCTDQELCGRAAPCCQMQRKDLVD